IQQPHSHPSAGHRESRIHRVARRERPAGGDIRLPGEHRDQRLRAQGAESGDPAGLKKRRDPRVNVALARGLEILRAFRPEEVQLGNIEIAKRTGIPKGTVSRLTYTLTAFGYLRYSEVTGMFSIGPGILAL